MHLPLNRKKESSKQESVTDDESGGSGTMIFDLFILIIVILFFLIPVIQRRPLIANKMRSKKLIWNLVPGLSNCLFLFIILIIKIIENVHSLINRKFLCDFFGTSFFYFCAIFLFC
ncbi:hypothetical protein DFR59_102367 [Falsibacillus pallidus]|uniref:Uncharacterized protein n=1 Tax=Falsibacillus pallidus TaxID=493781 RepID=A0A370GT91_9BACI|nr:hypothetical protein DFR59_102367 [Falsibacillus pallidus]